MDENVKKEIELIITTFKELSVRIFLHAGTLLSAIRDKDFIPYDNDYDFGVFEEELKDNKREIIIATLIKKGFILREPRRQHLTVFNLWSPYTHSNTDFFIFQNRENYYYHGSWGGWHYYPKNILNTLDEIDFGGLKVLIPHNAELFLENLYGKDWKTPKHMKKPIEYCNWTKNLKHE
jgi:phosphorylcholine metabolism protein LicD